MAISLNVFEPTATVDERLETLGISRQILHDAIMAGEAARATCTSNDPPILPGLLAWGRTVRALSELLAPLGWKRRDEGNYSTIEDGRLGIAIAVATGDEATGDAGAIPRTKYPKGPTTARAVERNNQQLRLFEDLNEESPADESTDVQIALTWILLIARIDDEVRFELSLPAKIGDDERIEAWTERLILDPFRVNSRAYISITLEPTPEISIPITARTDD